MTKAISKRATARNCPACGDLTSKLQCRCGSTLTRTVIPVPVLAEHLSWSELNDPELSGRLSQTERLSLLFGSK